VPDTVWHPPSTAPNDARAVPRDAPAQALGALVAAETLRAALGLATLGRVQAFDLGRGTFHAHTLPTSDGCAACGVTA
jgi:hypothetical protein